MKKVVAVGKIQKRELKTVRVNLRAMKQEKKS